MNKQSAAPQEGLITRERGGLKLALPVVCPGGRGGENRVSLAGAREGVGLSRSCVASSPSVKHELCFVWELHSNIVST